MIERMLLCLIILMISQCGGSNSSNLESSLQETVEYFEKLKLDYGEAFPNATVLAEINKKIADHVRNQNVREKREIPDEGILVLDGFQDKLTFNIKDIRDLCFCAIETSSGITWLAGVLDSEGLTLFQINNATLKKIGSHKSTYTRIIAEYCETGVLLILQDQHSLTIFRLSFISHKYILQPIQEFIAGDVNDLTTWRGMNRLYLGITTPRNISIYTWFGEHFDLVQVLNIGGRKLVPFNSKGFMHIGVTGLTTIIFRYSLRSNNFEVVQRLRGSKTFDSFQVIEGHYLDHFLSLSDDFATIIYKEVRDRFVPFQKLELATNSLALVLEKTVILISLDTKETLNTYQYDGWRFVRLNTEIRDVKRIRIVRIFNEELLLIKGSAWKLLKTTWSTKKSWKSLQDEIKRWCEDAKVKSQRKPVQIPEFQGHLKILNGRIQSLNTAKINGHDAQESVDILKKLTELSLNLETQKRVVQDPVFHSMTAKRVNIHCNKTCKAVRINTGDKNPKARTSEDVLKFQYLHIKDTLSLPCPLPAIDTKNLIVQGLTNGLNISVLEENLLKKSGAQIITEEHSIRSINTIRIEGPLKIATKSTKQWMEISELRVKELNLTDGGFLLPLNGSVTMPGSIEAKRVRLKKLPILHGSLKGLESLVPATFEMEPLFLKGDYNLQDVVIEEVLNVDDIVSVPGKSLKGILNNAVGLGDDFPGKLEAEAENMIWKNVTLPGFKNFLTTNLESLRITGRKHIPKNVVLSKDIYENLKLPKIEEELCGISASMPELRTSLKVDNLIAREINALDIIGRLKKSENLGFGKLGKLRVKNLKAKRINEANLNRTDVLNKFEKSNSYKGSLTIQNLSVNIMKGPLKFPRPSRIQKIIAKENVYVGKLNDVNFKDFLDNVVTINDNISLPNASFDAGFSSDKFVTELPFKLQNSTTTFDWKTKRILGNLESSSIKIPQDFNYNQESPKISIQGSARFNFEPSIINVNNINLEELIQKSWMKNENSIFTSSNLHFENISVYLRPIVLKGVSAPKSSTWQNLASQILSKTKFQEIKVPITFKNIKVPFISGSTTSTIKSEDLELNDTLENALTKNGEQIITGKWQFQSLNLTGNMKLNGKLNGLYLNKDVVRHDVPENIITGTKKVLDLSTKNLNGLDFDKWASRVFTENRRKIPVIKGRRTFGTLSIQNLNVYGTVKGKRMEEVLLKSTDQSIKSQMIEGNIESPGLTIDGFINDVNLTEIIDSQLKKNDFNTIIYSDIEFVNLNVFGNVTIDRERNTGRNLNNEETPAILEMISAIKEALYHRAIYINKFEFVPPNSIEILETSNSENCDSTNCNKEALKIISSNVTDLILIKLIERNQNSCIISVQRKRVSIYEPDGKDVHLLKELNIPRIENAAIETQKDTTWIILQLPRQTLILRYEIQEEIQDYILPRTEVLRITKTPSNELLLILSSGIWKLEGSGDPQNLLNLSFQGEIQSFSQNSDFYVKSIHDNNTILLKAHYS